MNGETVLYRGRTLVQGRDFDRKHGDILLVDGASGVMACLRCGERWVAPIRSGGFYATGSARCSRCGGSTRRAGRSTRPRTAGRPAPAVPELAGLQERLDNAVLNLRQLVRAIREVPRIASAAVQWEPAFRGEEAQARVGIGRR